MCPLWTDLIRLLEIGFKKGEVKGKKYTREQIVAKLRGAAGLLAKGLALGEVCRQLWSPVPSAPVCGMDDIFRPVRDLFRIGCSLSRILSADCTGALHCGDP
jgi:hypothetical protein